MEPIRDPEEHEIEHLARLGEFEGLRVLEIGAGNGRLTWRFASLTGSTLGVDLDQDRLRDAAASQPEDLKHKTGFALAAAEALPFPPGSFDAVVLAWSL